MYRDRPRSYWQYNTGYAQNSTTWDHSIAATSVVLSPMARKWHSWRLRAELPAWLF